MGLGGEERGLFVTGKKLLGEGLEHWSQLYHQVNANGTMETPITASFCGWTAVLLEDAGVLFAHVQI